MKVCEAELISENTPKGPARNSECMSRSKNCKFCLANPRKPFPQRGKLKHERSLLTVSVARDLDFWGLCWVPPTYGNNQISELSINPTLNPKDLQFWDLIVYFFI